MSIRSLSDLLSDLQEHLTNETVSFDTLLNAFHERGIGFFLFLFALPAAIPIPALGINTIIALPLLFLTAQIMIGRDTVWMPQSFRKHTIKSSIVKNVLSKTEPMAKKIEKLVKPRIGFMTQAGMSNIVGICAFIMALSVSIPLPLTNTVPSMGLALIGIGLMMRDGLAIIGGVLVGTIWVLLLFGVIIFVGIEGFHRAICFWLSPL